MQKKKLEKIICALHLPSITDGQKMEMSFLEDYLIKNLTLMIQAGMPAVMIQDCSRCVGPARLETVARMSALCALARNEFPHTNLGVIIEAHDGLSPIAISYAAKLDFVRIKVFVGTMIKYNGLLNGIGPDAVDYRSKIGSSVSLMADIHDRNGVPLGSMSIEEASSLAAYVKADALILTGKDINETFAYIDRVKNSGNKLPRYIGGGATPENIQKLLRSSDGVIVSSSLKKNPYDLNDIVRWDYDRMCFFMQAVNQT